MTEEVIKSKNEVLGQRNPNDMLARITLERTAKMLKKEYCLERRSMLCLQQPCQSGNNISFWLNDEVLGSKIGSEDKCIVLFVL